MITRYENKEGLVLFEVKYSYINIEKIFDGFVKILSSIQYSNNYTYNLIFINHPYTNYIGFSLMNGFYDNDNVSESDVVIFKEKLKRYRDGLNYLLHNNFKDIDIKELSEEETLVVLKNLYNLKYIPKCLHEENSEDSLEEKIQIVFSRPINGAIIMDKMIEFYEKYKQYNEYDFKMGIKEPIDKRIFDYLQNPYLTYPFTFFRSEECLEKNKKIKKDIDKVDLVLVMEFFDIMGVPDRYIDYIYQTNNIFELLDNNIIQLSNPENSTKTILNLNEI